MFFFNQKSEVPLKILKTSQRPRSDNFRQHCWNLSHETVPLTHNPDYQWTDGPWRSSGITTFPGNLEICSSNLGGGNLLTILTLQRHIWWPRRDETRTSASDESTQLLRSLRFSCPSCINYYYQAFPLHPAPSSSPGWASSPSFLSGLLTPLSVGGSMWRMQP